MKSQIKSAGLIVQLSNSASGWLAEFSRLQPQLHFIQLQHQLELLLLCSDTSKAPTETVTNSTLGLEIVQCPSVLQSLAGEKQGRVLGATLKIEKEHAIEQKYDKELFYHFL